MASLNPLQGNLGVRSAKHLLRRTTFKIDRARIDSFAGKTASAAVDELLTVAPLQNAQPVDPLDGKTWCWPPAVPAIVTTTTDAGLRNVIASWWIDEARKDASIGHRMELFWHQNFITTVTTAGVPYFFDYLALIRFYALGNVKKLALKMITDNVMLRYLNNNTNTSANPNENFAREFLELFTIQKGEQVGAGDYTTYTEADVAAAAKLLSGFTTLGNQTAPTTAQQILHRGNSINFDPETGIPRGKPKVNATTGKPNAHSLEAKVFSARFGNKTINIATASNNTVQAVWDELSAFVDMIFEQDATAKSYVRRLYRYFVSRQIDPEIENDIIAPLAADLKSNGYDVKPILKKLLASQHFFEKDDSVATDEIVGGTIKSPLDILLPTMNFFNVVPPAPPVATPYVATQHNSFYNTWVQQIVLQQSGFYLFYAADVAGYPAYYQDPEYARQWFNSSTIICRYKIGEMLVTGKRVLGNSPTSNIPGNVKLNLATWLKGATNFTNKNDAEAVVQQFLDYLLCETVDPDRFNYFLNDVFADGLPTGNWPGYWQAYLNGGNDLEVNGWLNRLLMGIMYSPEFQVM